MNHRERVLATLRHEEPDRIPVDLGSHGDSGILAWPYVALRESLGLRPLRPMVCNVMSQCVFVDDDVRRAIGVDTSGVYYQPRAWRDGVLNEGLQVQLPASWTTQVLPDGTEVHTDPGGHITHKRPAGGYYFDDVYSPLAQATTLHDLNKYADLIENYDRPGYLDMSFAELERVVADLYANTDHALVGYFGGHVFAAGLQLRGWENFLADLATGSPLAEALLDRLVEGHMRRFAHYAETVGKYVHVILVEDDLGMQDRPLLSPQLYRKSIKPYHSRLYHFIKQHCAAHLMLHTDGSVYALIPDLIEAGIDILNPVQYTAKDMDTMRLKKEFGTQVSFWGAGCDTQQVLPYGSPADVEREVRRRVDELAPGGGFVFCQVHNIQPQVPIANIRAMYEAVEKHGRY